jgi:hypothetical protein
MAAQQDIWATPLAKRLVDKYRSQDLTYIKVAPGVYDETTGLIESVESEIPAAGAVVKSMKGELDGVQQSHQVEAWIDHITVPWPISTNDRLIYLGKRWKVVDIKPTYGSGGSAAEGATESFLVTQDGDVITTLDGDPIMAVVDTTESSFKMYASKIIARAE